MSSRIRMSAVGDIRIFDKQAFGYECQNTISVPSGMTNNTRVSYTALYRLVDLDLRSLVWDTRNIDTIKFHRASVRFH
ncbi:hypothetical protein D3C75_792210 [compost metagenome]